MRSPRADEQVVGLVGRFYDAALDGRLWAGLAPHIAAAFNSDSAVLKVHATDGSVDLLDATDNLRIDERNRAWAEHWHRNDLWVQRAVALGLSRIVTGDDLVSPAEVRGSAFYQEWLRRLDIYHVTGSAFATGNGAIGILGVHRPPGAAHYGAAERRAMGLLLPHAERALRLGRHLAGASLVQQAALDALDRLETGVVVLDRQLRIVHANALAEAIFREGAEIGAANGRLRLRSPSLNAEFGRRVHAVLETAAGRPRQVAPVLGVARERGPPLVLAVAPLRPNWSRRDQEAPLALIFLRDPERIAAVPEQLRSAFGLTRAEAAVAAALARGWPLARIAAAHGVGIATVRSHLKKILAKTGTNRQAELVALIALSAVPADSPPKPGWHES